MPTNIMAVAAHSGDGLFTMGATVAQVFQMSIRAFVLLMSGLEILESTRPQLEKFRRIRGKYLLYD